MNKCSTRGGGSSTVHDPRIARTIERLPVFATHPINRRVVTRRSRTLAPVPYACRRNSKLSPIPWSFTVRRFRRIQCNLLHHRLLVVVVANARSDPRRRNCLQTKGFDIPVVFTCTSCPWNRAQHGFFVSCFFGNESTLHDFDSLRLREEIIASVVHDSI